MNDGRDEEGNRTEEMGMRRGRGRRTEEGKEGDEKKRRRRKEEENIIYNI